MPISSPPLKSLNQRLEPASEFLEAVKFLVVARGRRAAATRPNKMESTAC